MTTPEKQPKKKPVVLFLFGVVAIFTLVYEEISSPLLYHTLRGETGYNSDVLFVPPSLGADRQRVLSLDLGSGRCRWQPPIYTVPEEIDFHKTIITGYPSEDKRMIFAQMEALTGWPAKDEWDFKYKGISNHPFIKANYPHHEGVWGWEKVADQVVMMIRNIRGSMIEYHDIVWDIGYADSYEAVAASLIDHTLYADTPAVDEFLTWRDAKVMNEAHWYGWFIDYWMEGGLMRDVLTHKLTTPKHWNMLRDPSNHTKEEMDYDVAVGPDTVVTASYDPHCANGDVSGGCEPVAVFSAQSLRDYNEGVAETMAIAQVLKNDERTGKYVISRRNWNCIWRELIQKGKGPKTGRRRQGKRRQGGLEREGSYEDDYNFSVEMLAEMIAQLDRLIAKYGGPDWNIKATANRIVDLLVEHRALIQIELNEVNAGVRKLTDEDFLGPKERQRRMLLKLDQNNENEPNALEESMDHSGYFKTLDQKLNEKKSCIRKANAGKKVEDKAANAVAAANM